jgi:large subunit ribosomal protein L4
MELSLLNIKGKDTGKKVTLSDDIFAVEPNNHAIYLDVKQYLAHQRQGTHKAKERAEVSFSTKKLKKQKGTGGARAGSRRSPVFVGGGTIFGPRPRTYGFKVNKKVKDLARKSAFSHKLKESNVTVLENFTLKAPKTKDYLAILKDLSFDTKKTLLVIADIDKNIILSSRNLKKAKVVSVEQINTYDLVNAEKVVISEGSVSKIEALLN